MRSRDGDRGAQDVSALPQSGNIVFQHNLYDGSANPQVGSTTYTRTGSILVPDTSSSLASYSANALPFSVRYGGTETLKGVHFNGAIVNLLLRSEEFENAAWTAVGGGSGSANTATAPDGAVTADTISGGSAGDGLQQDAGAIAVSATYMFSVWLKTSTGSATVSLIVKDGGVEGNITSCPVTTTWKRFSVPYAFSSAATGNIVCQILVGNTSTVRAWGAQLENWKSNATGKRTRWGAPNPYVKTTTATATAGNSRYEIPNSIVSQLATRGSCSFWIYPEYDFTELSNNGNNPYLFSVNGELLSLATSGINGLVLWINNNSAVDLTTSSSFNAVYGMSPYRWNHIVCTWDTNPDSYKIYINKVLVGSASTALTAPTIGSNTMNFGGYDSVFADLAGDAIFSQIVLWKSVLTQSDVNAIYATRSLYATRTAIGTGKIFEVSLGTSLVPTTGDTDYAAGVRKRSEVPIYYPDSTTTLAPTTLSAFPIGARPLGGFNKGGYYFSGPQTNNILQSEAIGTSWVAIGAPTITEAGGTFLGSINFGTIAGVLGEGITQTVATATASTAWTGSVYASVGAGTLAARLTLEGDSGGTPEVLNADITLTTTPQRFHIYQSFTSGATGNIKFSFTLRAAGTARVGGFMHEKTGGTGQTSYWKKAAPYIKTTTAAKTSGWNQIIYNAVDSFNPIKGTAIVWAFLWYDPADDALSSDGPTLIAAPGQYGNFYWHVAPDIHDVLYGGVEPVVRQSAYAATVGRWEQYAFTWNQETGAYKLYKDGSETATDTDLTALAMLPRKLIIGGDYVFGNMDFWHGAIDKVTIYGDVNAAAIASDWTDNAASYGR